MYTSCLDEECQDLLKQYEGSGDQDIADHIIESLDVARRHRWEELTSKVNFTHSSRKSWALMRRLGAAHNHPSQHIRQSAPKPLPLISSRLLKHRTTRSSNDKNKFQRQVRMQGRPPSAAGVRQESFPSFNCSAENETSDSRRLRQHPRGIPEEPGPQSSLLAVQILLQNHGYPFHPEDLEKSQGDSR